MNFYKYFAFLAILVLCLLGQQATEAHMHWHKLGHKLEHAAKKVDKVVSHVAHAKKVIEAGGVVAGVIAAS